ncbi:hypothetical protein MUU74_17075 [Chryseobacterium daecheongense]|uniref:hypothetical protein n=1 Tax=Chryseobacterium daecheongense TaxID=192389 RepID=UPI001FD694B1|nr:hypothetical protein [Chryseobacterium daecheongense]UOU98192.1 hypothetical protein MUU74_17075 [Chryseobacterium daecheongense]
MPHYWGTLLVVTKDELIPTYYSCLASLTSQIRRYAHLPYGIKKVQRGCYNRPMLIDFDSLSEQIRESIGDPRKMTHPLIPFFQYDPIAVRFYTDYRFEDGTPLKDNFKEEYIVNASVLIAAEKLKMARLTKCGKQSKTTQTANTSNTSSWGLASQLCTDIATFNDYLPKLFNTSHSIPSSYRGFDRAWKSFFIPSENQKEQTHSQNHIEQITFNYESLISGKLKNQNRKKVTQEMIGLFNDLFAGQDYKPSRTEVADQYQAFLKGELSIINRNTGEEYDYTDPGFKEISENSIIAWLGKWENKIGTFAKRSGNRQKLMQQFIPWHKLKKIKEAGTLLSIDDRQPPFMYDNNRKRAWFYMGIDVASEAWTVWVWGKDKKGIIIEFYRQMVRNYSEWGFNLPLGLECESSLNSHFKDTFLKNGVLFDHVNIYKNRARSKVVERKFEELRYRHEKSRLGWMARPHALKEENQKSGDKETIIPFDAIIEHSLHDIEIWNNMPHSEYPDKTRWEVFCEKQNKNTMPTQWAAFLPYIGRTEISSCNAGIVKFRNTTFVLGSEGEIALNETLINLMTHIEGKEFTIYWLDGNDGDVLKAMIYYDQMLLCDLIPHPEYSRSIHERDIDGEKNRELMSAYENTVNTFMKERKQTIEKVMIIDHRKKTLNNKFQIPGLKKYIPNTTTAEEIHLEIEDIENEDYTYTENIELEYTEIIENTKYAENIGNPKYTEIIENTNYGDTIKNTEYIENIKNMEYPENIEPTPTDSNYNPNTPSTSRRWDSNFR